MIHLIQTNCLNEHSRIMNKDSNFGDLWHIKRLIITFAHLYIYLYFNIHNKLAHTPTQLNHLFRISFPARKESEWKSSAFPIPSYKETTNEERKKESERAWQTSYLCFLLINTMINGTRLLSNTMLSHSSFLFSPLSLCLSTE